MRNSGELHFERNGDVAFDFLGRLSGILRDDVNQGRDGVRVRLDVELGEGDGPGRQQCQEAEQHQHALAQSETDDGVHERLRPLGASAKHHGPPWLPSYRGMARTPKSATVAGTRLLDDLSGRARRGDHDGFPAAARSMNNVPLVTIFSPTRTPFTTWTKLPLLKPSSTRRSSIDLFSDAIHTRATSPS